jgi:hypothetical protein
MVDNFYVQNNESINLLEKYMALWSYYVTKLGNCEMNNY